MCRQLNFILAFGCLLGVAIAQDTYTIKPGDSLARIARMHNCSVDALAKENNLQLSTIIHPGQELKIPARTGAGAPAAAPAAAAGGKHTIQPGDTFTAISRRYNIPVEDLLAANPNADPRALRPGQEIRLGVARDAGSAAPETTPTRSADAETANASGETSSEPSGEGEEPTTVQSSIVTVFIDEETRLDDFAARHGTDVKRLNDLNGWDLPKSTLLARGSEIYVPRQQ